MERVSEYVFLAGFNLLFFSQFLTRPFKFATSELISTFYPVWIWMGRQIGRGKHWFTDKIYYYYPGCIPFLSAWYPPNILTAFISRFLSIDSAFRLMLAQIQAHYLLGSILAYFMFRQWTGSECALFGALTLTYAAYNIKTNQPCIAYTLAWLPGMMLTGWIGGVSFGMALLGGYWPIVIYFAPIAFLARWIWWHDLNLLWGLLIGLPQIILFLWYLPQSIRAKKTGNPGNWGKVPISRFLNLIWPEGSTKYISGLLGHETALYMGLLPLYFALQSRSGAWWTLGLAFLGMLGLIKNIGRIPARWTNLFTFSLVWLAVDGLTRSSLNRTALWGLILLQAFDLLQNRTYLTYWPFTEWSRKPSEIWGARPGLLGSSSAYTSGFPYFTGYMTETKTPGYTGGFALQRIHDKYGIKDPNGERVSKEEELKWLTHLN